LVISIGVIDAKSNRILDAGFWIRQIGKLRQSAGLCRVSELSKSVAAVGRLTQARLSQTAV
jgi:hypothetical protein